MDILYTLSYDRKPPVEEPLAQIIQILWNDGILEISRFAGSTLEFFISGTDENSIGTTAEKITQLIEKVAYVRLTKSCGAILGEGNEELNNSLQEFIRINRNAGTIKRP